MISILNARISRSNVTTALRDGEKHRYLPVAPISAVNAAGERVWFDLEPYSRFFEYGSHGPGAITSPKRPQLNKQAASWYTIENVLNGWVPASGK